ncbi:MAG: RDD family protein [Terriglobales bacterium]|jgi:uncharacterized RDD family membrane protein YckC
MSHDSQSARKDELSHDAAHTLPLLASGDDVRTGGSNRLDDLWRQEVVNRVAGFRNRRSKKILSGQFSMRLNFEAPPVIPYEPKLPIAENGVEASAADALPPTTQLPDQGSQAPPAESIDMPRTAASVEAPADHARILQFPRSQFFDAQPGFFDWESSSARHELAEPMFHKPRIIDVPETVAVAPPALADIALPANREEEDEPAPSDFDLPPQAAPLSRRLAAALIDALLISLATIGFLVFVTHGRPFMATTFPIAISKSWLAVALCAPLLFWTAYHYLFLVHGAVTPGMAMTRLRISTFDGKPVRRAARRWRALLMVLSCVSLGLGFFWALFDQDVLCWHDRMTRTCITTIPRSQ